MVERVLHYLIGDPEGLYVDACLGAAGHAVHLLQSLKLHGRVLAIDRDQVALQTARRRLQPYAERVTIVHADFRRLGRVLAELGEESISGILFDLGLSSLQLDDPERGFSYMLDGPLDMRADSAQELTAETIINEYEEQQLADIFYTYGEERRSRQAAARIGKARASRRITTTGELAEVLRPALEPRYYHRSLARIWMALRIAVNGELEALRLGLTAGVSALDEGGRVVVLAYHSLEDRLVKTAFKEWSRVCTCSPALGPCTCGANPSLTVLTARPETASSEEIAENSRAKPAKLRAAGKIRAGNVTDLETNVWGGRR
jgi:16S rRNA (cytosine1402-N4)-methyltransferase